MTPQLKEKTINKLKAVNALTARLFEKADDYDVNTLNAFPGEEQWNVLQNIEHLRMSEQIGLRYIKKQLASGRSFKKSGIKEKYNSWILNKGMRAPIKIKAPKIDGLSPSPEGLELKKIKDNWLALRKEYFNVFNELEEEYFQQSIWKHPAVGRLNFLQMLNFVEVHIKRHTKQIERTIKKVQKTA